MKSLYHCTLDNLLSTISLSSVPKLPLAWPILYDLIDRSGVKLTSFIGRLLLKDIKNYTNDSIYNACKAEGCWNSIASVRNFNKRRCACCKCDYSDEYRDKYSDKHVCRSYYEGYEVEDPELVLCNCTCQYPKSFTVDDDLMFVIIKCLKENGMSIAYRDLHYNDSDLERLIIALYELTPKNITDFEIQWKEYNRMVQISSYNVLRYMSGMSQLNYTN
jgi:hypothetical protein